MKTVFLPPDAATLMWSTRAIGYTTPSAVADIIDNSISANASEIRMEFVSGDQPYVSILDNGNGMDEQELQCAMKYGSSNPMERRSESDLGRFGLGLKTASLSQCRQLTVISKKQNVITAFQWDLDHIFEVKTWELLQLNADDMQGFPQIETLCSMDEGTIVHWAKLDKMCAGDEDKNKGFLLKIREVEEHLALTFHRFLQGEPGIKKVSIYSNGIIIQPRDPFFVHKSDVMPTERIPVTYQTPQGCDNTAFVTITPYILPFSDSLSQEELNTLGGKDGLIKNQGFYIYRNKRLIVEAEWFRVARKTDLTKLCRVKVDMPNTLDELWTIDVKKSMAAPPEVVLRSLRRIITPILQNGKRKYKFRAVKEVKADNGTRLWIPLETRKGIIYSINPDYPLLKDIMENNPNSKKMEIFLRLLEQNIPVNAIHTDFYDDKKFAFEDMDTAYENIKKNLKDLLSEMKPEDREEGFNELMTMKPFSEYEIMLEELGDFL